MSRLTGEWAPNSALESAELWELPDGRGPEDIAFDAQGHLYTGLTDGRVVRFEASGHYAGVLASLEEGGRPLGLAIVDDALIVCDSGLGRLLRVELGSGRVDVLAAEFNGRRLGFVNNPAVGSDGAIYFSESSTRFRQPDWRRALAAHQEDASVYAYDPQSGHLTQLTTGLVFANGVEIAPDGSCLVVAETVRRRLWKLWLQGSRAGSRELLVDDLPAYPDNVSGGAGGRFWVGLPSLRVAMLEAINRWPTLRPAAARTANAVPVPERHYGLVAAFDVNGQLMKQLHDPTGRVWFLTSAREHQGWLYLGSLQMNALTRVRLPE